MGNDIAFLPDQHAVVFLLDRFDSRPSQTGWREFCSLGPRSTASLHMSQDSQRMLNQVALCVYQNTRSISRVIVAPSAATSAREICRVHKPAEWFPPVLQGQFQFLAG